MKTRQTIILLLLLSGFSCNAPLEPDLLIPCDCSKASLLNDYQEAEGIVLFPNNKNHTYNIYSRSLGGGGIVPKLLVCSDSLFISLIKKHKITDSTRVSFRFAVIGEKINCIGIGATAMKVIDLKRL